MTLAGKCGEPETMLYSCGGAPLTWGKSQSLQNHSIFQKQICRALPVLPWSQVNSPSSAPASGQLKQESELVKLGLAVLWLLARSQLFAVHDGKRLLFLGEKFIKVLLSLGFQSFSISSSFLGTTPHLLSEIISPCGRRSIFSCVCTRVYIRAYASTYPQRPEVSIVPLPLSLILFFEPGSLTESGAHRFGQTGCPVRPWDSPVSTPLALGLHEPSWPAFMWVLLISGLHAASVPPWLSLVVETGRTSVPQ